MSVMIQHWLVYKGIYYRFEVSSDPEYLGTWKLSDRIDEMGCVGVYPAKSNSLIDCFRRFKELQEGSDKLFSFYNT